MRNDVIAGRCPKAFVLAAGNSWPAAAFCAALLGPLFGPLVLDDFYFIFFLTRLGAVGDLLSCE